MTFAEREADCLAFRDARRAADAISRARYAEADERARAILAPIVRRRWIAARLAELETIISQWCMRCAWPGRMPEPPFAAWEERAALWQEAGLIYDERKA